MVILANPSSLQRPVSRIAPSKTAITGKSVVRGLGVAWLAAALLASLGIAARGWFFEASTTAFNSLLLSLPSAVVAMLAVQWRAPVFSRSPWPCSHASTVTFEVYWFALYDQPHVLAARARGLEAARSFSAMSYRWRLPRSSLFLVSRSPFLSARHPIEALCDSPGLGQLAWQAPSAAICPSSSM